jgi:hypothetical protein
MHTKRYDLQHETDGHLLTPMRTGSSRRPDALWIEARAAQSL